MLHGFRRDQFCFNLVQTQLRSSDKTKSPQSHKPNTFQFLPFDEIVRIYIRHIYIKASIS